MRFALTICLSLLTALPLAAQEADAPIEPVEETPVLQVLDASETTLDEHLWIARPIVVFADNPADPRFQEQLDLLASRAGPLIERDVVVIFDADPAARTDVRQALRPRGFSMVILQRDGRVALRKPTPWSVREIMRAIDNLPLRVEEMGLTQ